VQLHNIEIGIGAQNTTSAHKKTLLCYQSDTST
jgi:hypothetical protein